MAGEKCEIKFNELFRALLNYKTVEFLGLESNHSVKMKLGIPL